MDKEKAKLKLIFWYSLLWILIFTALYLAYFVYFPDLTSTKSKWVLLFSGAISALAFACKYLEVSFCKIQNDTFKKVSEVNKYFYRYKNALILVFLLMLCMAFSKHINTFFMINAVCATVLFLFLSKTSSKILLKGQIEPQDKKYMANTLLRLNFNSSCATIFLFWGVLSIGLVILYHIFKDYEILTGYIFGLSTALFLESIICLIFKKSFLSADEILQKYNNSALKNVVEMFKVQNVSSFFEIYLIVLICSISVGANVIGLMGAFLPMVASANFIFLTVILILLSKKSRLTNTSNFHFKTMFLTALLSNVMLYFEIKYWLNTDYCSIAYCALLGSILGIISLYFNGSGNYNSEIQNIKKHSIKAFTNISVILILLYCAFIIADGLNTPLFAFYCILMSVLGFVSIAPIVAINQSEQYKCNRENYKDNLTLFSFISSILTFIAIVQVYDADILNPSIFLVLFGAVLVLIMSVYFVSNAVYKKTRKITLTVKRQKDKTDMQKLIKNVVYSASNTAFIMFLGLIILACVIFKKLGTDYLFALITGIGLFATVYLYKNDNFQNSIARIIIKYSAVILISASVLFI